MGSGSTLSCWTSVLNINMRYILRYTESSLRGGVDSGCIESTGVIAF